MNPAEPDPLERELLPYYSRGHRNGPIDVQDWAGGIPQTRARFPSTRLRRRWFSSLWLIPLGVVALVLSIAVVRELARRPWFADFIARYPGTSDSYVEPARTGFRWWLRWQHFLNLLFMMFIIRAGLQILADHPRLYLNSGSRPDSEWLRLRGPVPADRRDSNDPETVWTAKEDSVALPKHLGIIGFRHSIGLARRWHFSFDLLLLVNGVLFYVLRFSTDEWKRLIPTSLDVLPNALSTALQYLSLNLPGRTPDSAPTTRCSCWRTSSRCSSPFRWRG
jgi:sulfoxide reductase catalytic subunit YedY